MRNWRMIVFGLMLAVSGPIAARAENKLAFVVGINTYEHLAPEVQLQRAVTDAQAVGDALQGLGFRVTRITKDASLDALLGAFDRFTRSIEPGDTVLFYYAGHGISLDDGNYLIPADVPALGPNDERVAKRHAIAEHEIKQSLRNAGARVAIVVLDACRNNPFPASGTRAIGATTRGLARIDATSGVFSLYSAREGQTALDRLSDSDRDRNSVFTRVFLKELKAPGVSLSELGDAVRDEVAALASSAGQDQVPAVSNDLIGARSVFLAGPPPAATAAPASPAVAPPAARAPTIAAPAPAGPAPDEIAWSFIATTTDPQQLEIFLARFPQSARRAEAEARLVALREARVAALAPPAPKQDEAVRREAPPDPAVAECDRQAGLSFDDSLPPGVAGHGIDDLHTIDGNKAAAVCRAALAARPGDPRLQLELAVALATTERGATQPTSDEIIDLLQRSTAGGNKAAMAVLGVAFIELRRSQAGHAEAGIGWLEKASRSGIAVADLMLGQVYEHGRDVPADLAQARSWYSKGAEAGNPDAKAALDRLAAAPTPPVAAAAPPTVAPPPVAAEPPPVTPAAPAVAAPAGQPGPLDLAGHTAEIRNLAVSADGTRLASVSIDKTVRVWDVAAGAESGNFVTQDLYVALSPDGRLVAFSNATGGSNEVDVVEVASGTVLHRLSMANVMAAAFSPDGRRLATGGFGEDNAIVVWDLASEQRLMTLKTNRNTVQTLEFSRDGKRLVSSSADNSVRIFDAATGAQKVKVQLPVGAGGVNNAHFSPDGEIVAAGSWSAKLRTWNARTGKLLKEWLTQPKGSYTVAAVSGDGSTLASAGVPGIVQVWDLKTGRSLGQFEGLSGAGNSVAIAPDGRWIAYDGGGDNIVHIRSLQQGGLAKR